MRVAVPSETVDGERRVAVSPDSIPRLRALGLEVCVQAGAGVEAGFPDASLKDAGAEIAPDQAGCLKGASLVCKVQPPSVAEAGALPEGSALISFLPTSTPPEVLDVLVKRRITAFSFELVPRISRAQAMDALSSQASIGGYKAVLVGAARLAKILPLQMTAAGTIAPARVMVMGAGVAGLQAIATARRLGAVVEATDVRSAVREEVQSLGATFVGLELETQEGEGGYAREQSEEFLARQRELIAQRVEQSDLVITTAAVPGRRAPILITKEMVGRMRAGAVIVDLAADTGGNCELTSPGEEVRVGGVVILGWRNLAATVPTTASQMLARNLAAIAGHLIADGKLALDFDDEITGGSCAVHNGEIRNQLLREAAQVGQAKA
ncbi:MAG TPA: Re/Si-specific NAD(P)(+) transhydrogenase subunit alpha [Candidatus Nanopelagicaceae bacterium]|nr:Re/Si-specific NAD(P)(+) transhydrogenase subunit alpha [Candidatus Nanopelagicaceae bacterium]